MANGIKQLPQDRDLSMSALALFPMDEWNLNEQHKQRVGDDSIVLIVAGRR
tara:strand:+ start:686 stop:838 length:153 start_codon:yes stop_codon:yes gene_type:complete